MINSFKHNIDYLDSLPLRESSTTYFKHDPVIYCDYKESKLIHFNKTYKKFNNKLQQACIKFIGHSVEELANYLVNLKTKNKFHKLAVEFVHNCLYKRNSYNNELDFVEVLDGVIIRKIKLGRKRKYKNSEANDSFYKSNYKLTDGSELIYRNNCYFYLIEDNDCYSMDHLGNTFYIRSKYLQLNKKELKYYGLSNE